MPATVALVGMTVLVAAVTWAEGGAVAGRSEEWLRTFTQHAAPPYPNPSTPQRVLTPPYRDAIPTSSERGMKALSPRVRPRATFPSVDSDWNPSSSEEAHKSPSSSEEEYLEPITPKSSSEELTVVLPLPTESRPPVVTPRPVPPVEPAPTTTTPAPPPPSPRPTPRPKKPRRKVISITRHYQGDLYSLEGKCCLLLCWVGLGWGVVC